MTYDPIDYLPYDFANRRHIGPSPEEMAQMFSALGVDDLEHAAERLLQVVVR